MPVMSRLTGIWSGQRAGLRDPLRRRTFAILLLTLGGLWAAIVLSYLYASFLLDQQDLEEDRGRYVDERADQLNTTIAARISNIFLLPGLPVLRSFLERPNAITRGPLETYLQTIVGNDRDVDDVRILDLSGKEILHVLRTDDGSEAATVSELQDKSDRYYFHEAKELPRDTYYLSPLDLDVEYGQIEEPWEPTVRIAAPLFSQQGFRLGLVVINVGFESLLKTFVPNFREEQNATLLLNDGGYILAGAPDELLWGFMFPNGQSFAGTYPEVWNKISAADAGQFRVGNRTITFRTIAPLPLMRRQFATRRVTFVGSVGTWKIVDFRTASFGASNYNAPTIAVVLVGLLMVLATSWIFSRYPSERIQILRRQRVQEHRINALLDNTAVSIIVRDLAGRFTFANAEFCRLVRRQRDEIVGRKVREVLPAKIAEAIEASDEKLTRDTQLARFEAPVTDFGGQRRTYVIHKFLLPDENGQPDSICTVGLDVTDLKNAENSLRVAKDAAEMATRAKSDFLAAMSHEIRTPMNGVVGMVDLLRDSPLTQDQQGMVTTIRDSAYTLLGIIGDILDFSKLEAGRMALDPAPVSVVEVVESVMHALSGLGYAKNLMMPLFCDPEIPTLISADPIRLRQILYNLLGNAVKFTQSIPGRRGQVVFRADLAERESRRVKVRYSVADNGIGMDDDTRSRLFRPFEQGERSTARRFGGTGLGLSICRQLSEMMEGALSVSSAPGVGSTFTFEVWHDIVEDKGPQFDLRGKRILFIGRRATAWIANYLTEYVVHCGGEMDWVYGLDEAPERLQLALAEGKPFDALLIGAAVAPEVKAALRDRLHATPRLESLRYIFMNPTRTEAARVTDDLTVSVSGRPLCRSVILPAIAIACGRASPGTLSAIQHATAPAVELPTVEEAVEMGQLILVAEDNAINREVLRRQLATLGYAAEMATNGAEALTFLESGRYALLLTDCHMPEMDGYELTKTIREAEAEAGGAKRLPIIAITANALHGEAERCLSCGMDDYLAKPIELPAFREKLRRWMPDARGAPPIRLGVLDSAPAAEEVPSTKDVFDPTALKRLIGGSASAAIRILGDYGASARETFDEINRALETHSAPNLAMAAHKLKSSSRAVGAGIVADIAERLERAGKAESWDEIDAASPGLESALQLALKLIDAHVEEFSTERR